MIPDLDSHVPWYWRAGAWALDRFGFPMIVALALGGLFIWLSVGDVKAIRADVTDTKQSVQHADETLRQHNQQMVDDAKALRDEVDAEIRILQAMCYNAAKSDAARLACAGK